MTHGGNDRSTFIPTHPNHLLNAPMLLATTNAFPSQTSRVNSGTAFCYGVVFCSFLRHDRVYGRCKFKGMCSRSIGIVLNKGVQKARRPAVGHVDEDEL